MSVWWLKTWVRALRGTLSPSLRCALLGDHSLLEPKVRPGAMSNFAISISYVKSGLLSVIEYPEAWPVYQLTWSAMARRSRGARDGDHGPMPCRWRQSGRTAPSCQEDSTSLL